jgi:multiple antibiotic resistance protein
VTFVSATIILILVLDPLGNIPVFLTALKHVPVRRKRAVILRELLIALGVLMVFLFVGPRILSLLHISDPALNIAGGIILLLIAIKMIFPNHEEERHEAKHYREPFIVPLAIPYVAGPSALATVMLLASREPGRWPEWLAALTLAWLISGGILLLSSELEKLLGDRGVVAVERLMGMILTAIAVEMALGGIIDFIAMHRP